MRAANRSGHRFHGAMPSLRASNDPDEPGYGQIVPFASVDQYAATLARCHGVGNGDIAGIFPSLANFEPEDWRFMG